MAMEVLPVVGVDPAAVAPNMGGVAVAGADTAVEMPVDGIYSGVGN